MRPRVAMPVVVATAAVGLGLFTPPSAPAGCVGPSLTVPGAPSAAPVTTPAGDHLTTVRLVRGQSVTVRGRWFFRGCHDTTAGGGCMGPSTPPPEQPARNVKLTLVQGARTWTLGTADADGPSTSYAARWNVTLPSQLQPGDATLTARGTPLLHVIVAG
jgi:hypothetical protein